jgi:hypothetical protein
MQNMSISEDSFSRSSINDDRLIVPNINLTDISIIDENDFTFQLSSVA